MCVPASIYLSFIQWRASHLPKIIVSPLLIKIILKTERESLNSCIWLPSHPKRPPSSRFVNTSSVFILAISLLRTIRHLQPEGTLLIVYYTSATYIVTPQISFATSIYSFTTNTFCVNSINLYIMLLT